MARTAPKTKRPTKKEVRKEARATRRLKVGNVCEITPGVNPGLEDLQRSSAKPLSFKTEAQYNYVELMREKTLVIGDGPAGTGKSYIAIRWAIEQLNSLAVKRIIVTRPMVEAADESMGFLPGDVAEKFAPYFEPLRQIFLEDYSQTHLDNLFKRGKVEIAPLPLIRGLTFDNCIVIADECQNMTAKQMRLLLTRVGENCTVILNGDDDQKDIKGRSGLEDAIRRFGKMDGVGHLRFTENDIVRSAFVREILARYRQTI